MKKWITTVVTVAGLLFTLNARAEPTAAELKSPALMMGDSMMRLLGHAMEKALNARGDVQATAFTSLGSGLARLDAFDWLGQMTLLMNERKPATVVVFLGANDKQPLKTADGQVVSPGDAAWRTEYAARVGAAMDRLIDGGAKRVIWMELPDMREAKLQADAQEINAIVQAEAERRPAVIFFPTRSVISRKPGTFTPYFFDSNGAPIQVRDPDGVHLSRAGADMVSKALIQKFWN